MGSQFIDKEAVKLTSNVFEFFIDLESEGNSFISVFFYWNPHKLVYNYLHQAQRESVQP